MLYANATVLVLIVTKNEIIIAVDSKKTIIADGTNQLTNKLCKAGEFYFAIAGFSDDPAVNFSMDSIVTRILKSAKNKEDVTSGVYSITDSLKWYFRLFQQNNNDLYITLRNADSSGAIFMATRNKNNLIAYLYEDTLTNENPVNIRASLSEIKSSF